MNTYVCAELVNNVCSTWVEHTQFLPPLSMEQGVKLGSLVLLCYATAWGISYIAKLIVPR